MMNYSNEQKQAITEKDVNILVSASAGAGKTGVLVARLVKRCVEDRIPITRILAVTFTQAAAAEMKKRLAKELNAKQESTIDESLKIYLQEQIINLENADITTIDSYCLKVIQKYYNVIGLDPAITANILSGGMQETYLRQAFDEKIQSYGKSHFEELSKLFSLLSRGGNDFESLYEIIKEIQNHAQSAAIPSQWYAKAKQYYTKVHHFSDFPTEIQDKFYAYIHFLLDQLQEAIAKMTMHACESKKIKIELITAKQNALQACIHAIEEKNYSSYCMRLKHFAELKTSSDTTAVTYTQARSIVEGASSIVNQKLLSICYDESVFINDNNAIAQSVHLLLDFAQDVYARFVQIKQANTAMDFTDMERYALNILEANRHTVANQIRESFDEIMIDEFQDTSELQNMIIEKIAKENNVFRVGDIKQSIYRFRQAKPELMRRLMEDPKNKTITLRNNYRSKESVVQFTNLLFQKIMNVPGCQDHYDEKDTVSIGTNTQKEIEPSPIIFAKIALPSDADDTDENPQNKDLKAQWIAKQILILMKENPSLTFKHFAVLLRGHADKKYLKNAFDLFGIPYDIDTRQGFFQSELCQTITSYCEAILNPHHELSLLAILTSEFYEFSDQQIAELKLQYHTLYDGIKAQYPNILEDLKYFYDIAKNHSIQKMLSELSSHNHFIHKLSPNQKANFDYLFEKTVAITFSSLYQFLEFINNSKNENSSEAISKGKDDSVVTVTTIHQSKGLQYKVVFIWGSSQNRFSDNSSSVMIDDSLGLGLDYVSSPYRIKRPTIQRIAISHKSNLEDLEEFTRLLYVALTRAEEKMYIVDVVKKEINPVPITLSLLNKRKGMTNLILSALDDNLYFKQIIAYPQDIQENIPERRKENHILPSFQKTISTLAPVKTPSQTERPKSLPNLSFQETSEGTKYGSNIHEIVEQMPNRLWTHDDFQGKNLRKSDIEKLLSFSNSKIYQEALQMEIHKELPFYLEENHRRLLGSMDFVAIGSNKIILIDFKTDASDLNTIVEKYTAQLNLYRHALESIYHLPVEAYIYSFHHQTEAIIKKEKA